MLKGLITTLLALTKKPVTIQYPEEKRQLPERFRYIPMLIYDTPKGEDRCTACGICAKVCPPQCIWIVRDKDPNGKPVPRAADFYIDASICMSCGFTKNLVFPLPLPPIIRQFLFLAYFGCFGRLFMVRLSVFVSKIFCCGSSSMKGFISSAVPHLAEPYSMPCLYFFEFFFL